MVVIPQCEFTVKNGPNVEFLYVIYHNLICLNFKLFLKAFFCGTRVRTQSTY
jgi:hypothetical protein